MSEPSSGDKGWRELPKDGRGVSPWLIAAVIIGILLLIFIVQNSNDAEVTWLFVDTTTKLWVVILVSAVVGYLVGQLIETGLRRRRRARRD